MNVLKSDAFKQGFKTQVVEGIKAAAVVLTVVAVIDITIVVVAKLVDAALPSVSE